MLFLRPWAFARGCIIRYYYVLPFNSSIMSIFELSKSLRLFLSLGSNHKFLRLGKNLPVSIRKRYTFSQSIVIYQERDYDFFTAREIQYLMSLAESLVLDFSVTAENGVPVIEITDYNINDD